MGAGRGRSRRAQAVAVSAQVDSSPAVSARPRRSTRVSWEYDPEHVKGLNMKNLNYSYVTTEEGVAECAEALRGARMIGFDIETTGFAPQKGCVRLMQFAVEEPEPRQWVVDCFEADPAELLEILADPDHETVVHYANFEQAWLQYHYGVRFGCLFDTCVAARKLGGAATKKTKSRLMDVSRRYLGRKLSKTQQASYWDAKVLSEDQIGYGAKDAAILLDLVHPIKKHVVEEGLQREVEKGIKAIYSQQERSLRNKQEWRDDEYNRARRAVSGAQDVEELAQVAAFSRQLVLPYRRRGRLAEMVTARHAELALSEAA